MESQGWKSTILSSLYISITYYKIGFEILNLTWSDQLILCSDPRILQNESFMDVLYNV